MLPSLSASEPYMCTYSPAPVADTVTQVIYYFFNFPDRIECTKTPWAFCRYLVREILAEDDIIPGRPR